MRNAAEATGRGSALGQAGLSLITEGVHDVAFLIGQMGEMVLPEVSERHILGHRRQWAQVPGGWQRIRLAQHPS